LDYGFRYLGLERIRAATTDLNAAAQQCLLHLGFAEEGRERHALWICGEYRDRLLYGMLREEWCGSRPGSLI
ncbi:MAG: GNAT family N-acetyltransferase, partial [Bacteroidales bacterium]|nr:GNAT family N-acetyltransferase [Bacteroidales bacterium]